MARKTWIKVRRGILDSKHTDLLGAAWYLFFYILDQADWKTGKIVGWKDQYAADELGKPLSLIRYHRQHLEKEKYIVCEKRKRDQIIMVNRWKDPRKDDFDDNESTQNNVVLPSKTTENSIPSIPRVEQELSKSRARVEQELSKSFNDSSINLHSSSSQIPHNTYQIPHTNRDDSSKEKIVIHSLMIEYFIEQSKVFIPENMDYKQKVEKWFDPIADICELVDYDSDRAKNIICLAIKKYDSSKMKFPITSPKSIKALAAGIIGEEKRKLLSDDSMEFRADEFLAEKK